MNNRVIGINIKKYRKIAGLTQEKLAELLNISTVHMSHMECGHVSMSLEILLKLCDHLYITPNQLLYGAYSIQDSSLESVFSGMEDETKVFSMQILELVRNYEKRIRKR